MGKCNLAANHIGIRGEAVSKRIAEARGNAEHPVGGRQGGRHAKNDMEVSSLCLYFLFVLHSMTTMAAYGLARHPLS